VPSVWRHCGAATLLALGFATMTAVPAAAKDTYAFYGPLEIRIVGANGAMRDFVALSTADRSGASALVKELAAAMQGPALPIERPPATPYYRIGVSHLGLTDVTMPWARLSDTSFSYYAGDVSHTFLMVEFRQGDTALQQRRLTPSPEVARLLGQHIQGMSPIGIEGSANPTTTDPWEFEIGAMVLAVLSLMVVEDRQRRRPGRRGRSAGKGT
jgi:hypothetical protein